MHLFMGNIAFQGLYFHVVIIVPAFHNARDPGLALLLCLAIKAQIPVSKYPPGSWSQFKIITLIFSSFPLY